MGSGQLVATIISILIIVVVLFLIWFLYRRSGAARSTGQEEATPPVKAASPAASPVASPAAVPGAVKAVEPAARDDLSILEGIGPKVNSLLQTAGITTFAKLAETDPDEIMKILQANRLQMLDPRSWPEQARLAAAGDDAALKALQEKLKGGRAV